MPYIPRVCDITTIFARSNAADTIYFTARICAAFIRERHLLIPVAAREAILRETVDWYRWSRIFWPLCWCRRRLQLILDCLSCTCHRNRVARHVHVLVFLNSRRGAATIRERPLFHSTLSKVRSLFESGVWSSEYGLLISPSTSWFVHGLVVPFRVIV